MMSKPSRWGLASRDARAAPGGRERARGGLARQAAGQPGGGGVGGGERGGVRLAAARGLPDLLRAGVSALGGSGSVRAGLGSAGASAGVRRDLPGCAPALDLRYLHSVKPSARRLSTGRSATLSDASSQGYFTRALHKNTSQGYLSPLSHKDTSQGYLTREPHKGLGLDALQPRQLRRPPTISLASAVGRLRTRVLRVRVLSIFPPRLPPGNDYAWIP